MARKKKEQPDVMSNPEYVKKKIAKLESIVRNKDSRYDLDSIKAELFALRGGKDEEGAE